MQIYDQTIVSFLQKAERLVKEILAECGLEVRRSRFLYKRHLYPIHVVVYEGKEWGHFNAPYFQIGLNRKLVYLAKDSVLRDILRHELAHYLTLLEHGPVASHGKEFHQICERYAFPKEVAEATMNLEGANADKVGDLDAERVLEKVKKLLQLAQSSNAHEAELATLKANTLLLRHNLERLTGSEEPIYLDRLLPAKKLTTKLMAIQEILKHFVVKTVLSKGSGECCLEVSGSLTNVKLARYVAEFLDREFDHLWDEARAQGLQGLRAKNSFFLGIARGYDEKMKKTHSDFSPTDQKALVVVRADLEDKARLIYGRLGSVSSGARVDEAAGRLGIEKGRGLSIRQGVETSAKGLYLPSR